MPSNIRLYSGSLLLPEPVAAALRSVGAKTLVDVVVWLQSWAAFPSAMPQYMAGQDIGAILLDVTAVLRGTIPDDVLYPPPPPRVAFGALIPRR